MYCDTFRCKVLEKRMNRTSKNNGTLAVPIRVRTNWLYDAEPYSRTSPRTFGDVADDLRLKSALKRAVAKIEAPSYLIDTIRKEIRK